MKKAGQYCKQRRPGLDASGFGVGHNTNPAATAPGTDLLFGHFVPETVREGAEWCTNRNA
jgi:hypothetical protein